MATIPLVGGDPETLDLSYGSGMQEEYRFSEVSFGDFYDQRAALGLNSARQVWRMQWKAISDDDAEMLRLFFRALKGVSIIDWAPYGQDQSKLLKWTANGWAATPSGFLVQDCSITLTQKFDL